MAKYQAWKSDAVLDMQRMVNRTLHLTSRNSPGCRRRPVAESSPGQMTHPFRLTADGEKCRITGGHVFGYEDDIYIPDQEFPVADGVFYIAVTPEVIDHAISAEIISSGKTTWLSINIFLSTHIYNSGNIL